MLSLYNLVSWSYCHKFYVKIMGQSSLEKGYLCQHCHEIWGHSEAFVTTLVTNNVTKWLNTSSTNRNLQSVWTIYRNKERKKYQCGSLLRRNRWWGSRTDRGWRWRKNCVAVEVRRGMAVTWEKDEYGKESMEGDGTEKRRKRDRVCRIFLVFLYKK